MELLNIPLFQADLNFIGFDFTKMFQVGGLLNLKIGYFHSIGSQL
jgi:hypothetical protein